MAEVPGAPLFSSTKDGHSINPGYLFKHPLVCVKEVHRAGVHLFLMLVTFNSPLMEGDTAIVKIAYGGAPDHEVDQFTFYVDEQPTNTLFDPNQWLLDQSNEIITETPPSQPPTSFALHTISPNPFNPATTIRYSLESGSSVRLTIHDIRGRLIATLVDCEQENGFHRAIWTGAGDGGEATPSAVYFARLEAEGKVAAQKLILVR